VSGRFGKLANLLARNMTLIVTAAVSMFILRVLVRNLGLAEYGLIALALQIVRIVTIVSNALRTASARYVTQCMARQDDEEASTYLVNTIACLIAAGALALLGALGFGLISRDAYAVFLIVLLVGSFLNSLSGVFGVGNFVRERFVWQGIIRSIGQILRGGVCYVLVVYVAAGIWSVAIALLVSSAFLLLCFAVMLRAILPSITLRAALVGLKRMREVGSYVGWVVLLHCGIYIYRAGTMATVKAFLPREMLGKYAIAITISSLVRQMFTSLTVVSSPAIYRDLGRERFQAATRGVQRFHFLLAMIGVTIITCFVFEGVALLQLVLGAKTPAGIGPILLGCVISSLVVSAGVPFSVYLAGINQQRNLGIIWLVEGVIIVGLSVLLLRDGTDRLIWLAYLPGMTSVVKVALVVPLAFRKRFVFSSMRAFVQKGLQVLVMAGATVGLRLAVGRFVTGGNFLSVFLRLGVICLPLAAFVAGRLFRPRLTR